MRRIVRAAWIVCVVASPLSAGEPFVDLSFDDACKKAADEGKLVFIDFYTTWCPPCRLMDQTTFKHAGVTKLLAEKVVALKVDAEKDRELARRFQIHAFPTFLFVKPDGTVAGRTMGYRDAKSFQADALAALSGKDPMERMKQELQEAGENDPMARMKFARQLAMQGKQAEALEHLLWCFDHGLEHGSAFYGVRLSFLLSDIERLGRQYPPAMEALVQRRDRAEAQLLAGKGSPQTLHDFSALNRTLQDDARTLRVYEGLSDAEKDRLGADRVAEDLLRQARRYDEILRGENACTEMIASVTALLSEATTAKAGATDGDAGRQEMLVDSQRRYAISSAAEAIEILAGANLTEPAKGLIDDVLKFDPSEATRATLTAYVRRADNADVMAYLEQRSAEAAAQTSNK